MSAVASLLALLAALMVVAAYPAKDDEAYYYNRLQDLSDNQKTRNLDGIDSKDDAWPGFVAKTDQGGGSEKGAQTKFQSGSHIDGIGGGHLVRNLEHEQGGGNLLRGLDLLRDRAAYLSRNGEDGRRYHYLEAFKRNAGGCCDVFSGVGFGNEKRNMDEIDRSSFNSFVKKNFDEIDRSGFGSFTKKNFDEIDRSGFGSFVKRSAPPSTPKHPHN